MFAPWKKAMTNLDSVLKSWDIALLTKVHLVKAMVFPAVVYGCERWTIKKAEQQRIDAFKLWFWISLLRVFWLARRPSQPILKKINPEYSLEGPMLELKHQYPGHLIQGASSLEKDPDTCKDWRQGEKGAVEDEMVGWHHQHNWHEQLTIEQNPGDSEGQKSLWCFSPQGCKELDTN